MSDMQQTRDMAVSTAAQMEAHVKDCFEVRQRNEKLMEKIDYKIDKNANEINAKLDKIMWIVLPALGGLFVITHGVDWFLTWMGHK